jgi:hypothetical protein
MIPLNYIDQLVKHHTGRILQDGNPSEKSATRFAGHCYTLRVEKLSQANKSF